MGEPSKAVVMFSGGAGSWGAAKRTVEKYDPKNTTLLFADTLIEDEDLYRYLVEASANAMGRKAPRWALAAACSVPRLETSGASLRRRVLLPLARRISRGMIGLEWTSDGRDPWQLFFDQRFLGNHRVDLCSRVLKRELMRDWLEEHRDPTDTAVVLGFGWEEPERFERAQRYWGEWTIEAPMTEKPYLDREEMFAWLRSEGIEPPRLYKLGFNHNNCGGFCVKAGQAQFAHLLKVMPERYAYHERREQEFREFIGKDVSILVDRRGGGPRRPLTLRAFRERIEADATLFDARDFGSACSCVDSPFQSEELADAA